MLRSFTRGVEKQSPCRVTLFKYDTYTTSRQYHNTIFTAEVSAINFALNIISKNKHYKYIIFSESVRNKKLENPLDPKEWAEMKARTWQPNRP